MLEIEWKTIIGLKIKINLTKWNKIIIKNDKISKLTIICLTEQTIEYDKNV
jgi:hypothetical protein